MKAKAGSTAAGGRSEKANKPPNFEFCAVCNLNHNQGGKHKYFPKHAKSLSSILSRFQRKVSEVRFFVRNPSFLRPEHAELNRIWCIFCGRDITEFDSTFACANMIYHLSGGEHLKNMKEYLRRHGGGMDKMDSFRVSEEDFVKWEGKCEALEGAGRSSQGAPVPSVQAELAKEMRGFFGFLKKVGADFLILHLLLALGMWRFKNGGSTLGAEDGKTLNHSSSSQEERKTKVKEKLANEMSSSGVVPPWLELDVSGVSFGANQGSTNHASSSSQTKKVPKLNPNRVGAAWAEKRRVEMEMEKRGEIVVHYDPDWLPDFGRVWQAGTRKESKREFKMEARKTIIHNEPETKITLQPYVSKRMRLDSNGN